MTCCLNNYLPEPMLTHHQWDLVDFTWWQMHGKYPMHLTLTRIWKKKIINNIQADVTLALNDSTTFSITRHYWGWQSRYLNVSEICVLNLVIPGMHVSEGLFLRGMAFRCGAYWQFPYDHRTPSHNVPSPVIMAHHTSAKFCQLETLVSGSPHTHSLSCLGNLIS